MYYNHLINIFKVTNQTILVKWESDRTSANVLRYSQHIFCFSWEIQILKCKPMYKAAHCNLKVPYWNFWQECNQYSSVNTVYIYISCIFKIEFFFSILLLQGRWKITFLKAAKLYFSSLLVQFIFYLAGIRFLNTDM